MHQIIPIKTSIAKMVPADILPVHIPMDCTVPSSSAIFTVLLEATGCTDAWDVRDLSTYLQCKSISTLLLFVTNARSLPSGVFCTLRCMFEKMGRVVWIVDDMGVLTKCPLPLQMETTHREVPIRGADEIVADILGELLTLEIIPSLELLELLVESGRLMNPRQRMQHVLGLAILEWASVEWTKETYLTLPSLKNSILNDGEDVMKLCKTYIDDAKLTVRRLAAVYRVFNALRGLFGESFCNCKDLLTASMMTIHRVDWFEKLGRTIYRVEPDELMRRWSVFQKILHHQKCPFTRELLQLLQKTTTDHIEIISQWCLTNLPTNWEQIALYETRMITLGQTTKKLLTPRILEHLQMALEHPEFYFEGNIVKDAARVAVPDTSLVHRLAGECGRMINTLDWYTSFREMVDPKRKLDEAQLMMRFLRSVNELHLFGLLAPTKKRKDHYERLVVFQCTF